VNLLGGGVQLQPRKVDFDLSLFSRLMYPRHVVLATCLDKKGKANIIPLSFSMPVSYSPPILVISVGLSKYSHQLIEETGEYVVNIPTGEMGEATMLCGTISGRECDKFKKANLTPLPAKVVKPPLIKECVGHLECKVRHKVTAGDHTLFIGDVVAATVDDGIFDYESGFIALGEAGPLFAPISTGTQHPSSAKT